MDDVPDPREQRRPPRIRRPHAHEIGSLLPWSLVAVLGDPIMILAPFILTAAMILAVLGLGSTGQAQLIVPVVSPPPLDAYQDVGAIQLFAHGTLATWLLRAAFLVLRAGAIAALAGLAIRRARGLVPDLRQALADGVARARTLAGLELVAFGVFASVLVLRASLIEGRNDSSVETALLFGVLFLPTAFIAALADGLAAGPALRRSFAFLRRRPLGHLTVSFGLFAGVRGIERLATAGELGRPPALSTTLLAFLCALLTMVALTALARRYLLLYSDAAVAARPSPRPARLLRGPAPAERTRDRRAGRGGPASEATGEPADASAEPVEGPAADLLPFPGPG